MVIMRRQFWLFVIVVGCMVKNSSAAVALELLQRDPDHPDYCQDPVDGQLHLVGSTWPMKDEVCGIVECVGSYSTQLYFSYATCGVVSVHGGNCRLEEDRSQPYPHCCPKPVCDLDDTDDHMDEDVLNYDVTLDNDGESQEISDPLADFVAWLFTSDEADNEVQSHTSTLV